MVQRTFFIVHRSYLHSQCDSELAARHGIVLYDLVVCVGDIDGFGLCREARGAEGMGVCQSDGMLGIAVNAVAGGVV